MYVRPQNYTYPSKMRVPENYSGSVFREQPEENEEQTIEEIHPDKPGNPEVKETKKEHSDGSTPSILSPSGFRLRLNSLFGGNGRIGTEEILIIALILLLADSENNDDLVLFLVLLFFIK